MPDYRLYCIDGADHIVGAPEHFAAADDKEALVLARAMKTARCEVWQGNRFVAAIPKRDEKPSASPSSVPPPAV